MTNQKTANNYIKVALALFFISALYGWLMRLSSIYQIPNFDYTRFLQAHSHVTFLGWGFIGVTTLFNYLFLDNNTAFSVKFKWIFGIEIISIFLMLVSFPLQGYKLYSIILLSVFLLTSYVYVFNFFKSFSLSKQHRMVKLFVNASLLFYVLSSIGIWAIGIVVATQGKTDLYYNSIYFYLHFLYNGFFVFSLFGLFFYYLSTLKIDLNNQDLKLFYWLTVFACVPAYTLSLIESESVLIIGIGFIAAIVQLIAVLYLVKFVQLKKLKLSLISKYLIYAVIFAYILKVCLQFGSAFPQATELILSLKPFFVIGYIHLVTLGFLTPFLLFLLVEFKLILVNNKLVQFGFLSLSLGVFLTELFLFGQGFLISLSINPISNYSLLLFLASTVLLLGIALILVAKFITSK